MRVLILAYDFPPLLTAGAKRPYAWFKYFHEFGAYPIIVTINWANLSANPNENKDDLLDEISSVESSGQGDLIRVSLPLNLRDKILQKFGKEKLVFLRKSLSFFLSFLKYYFVRFDNTRNIYIAAHNYLQLNRCDIILATGEPFVLFKHAYSLSKEFNIPYILDYRDGWTTGFDLELDSKKQRWLTKLLLTGVEKKYMNSARLITTASDSYIPLLEKIMEKKNKFSILNGFFEEDFSKERSKKKNDALVLVYSGRIYDFQPLELFLKNLATISEKYKSISVIFKILGGVDDSKLNTRLAHLIKSENLSIRLMPRFKNEEYANILRDADLLILLADERGGWLNAKIFDYLAAKTSILLFKNDKSVMERIITECNAGFMANDEKDLLSKLDFLFEKFLIEGKFIKSTVNYDKYSRRNQTGKLVQLLKQCVE